MSFLDHLEELRRRILNSLIAVGVAFCACYYFSDKLFALFSRLILNPCMPAIATLLRCSPETMKGAILNQTKITESFTLPLKLAFMASIFLAAPFILAQVWLFISPGLYAKEKRYAIPFIFLSSFLFVVGGLFGYFIAIPFAISFLIGMGKDLGLQTLLNVTDAFDLVIALELGLGVVFEIPALIFLLSRLGLVTGGFLLRNTKYAVLGSFVVAAIITPTGDIPNMMVMAVPMILLYLFGIIIAYVCAKKRTPDE
jgi:sec-independent protein translocase protein TatC